MPPSVRRHSSLLQSKSCLIRTENCLLNVGVYCRNPIPCLNVNLSYSSNVWDWSTAHMPESSEPNLTSRSLTKSDSSLNMFLLMFSAYGSISFRVSARYLSTKYFLCTKPRNVTLLILSANLSILARLLPEAMILERY